MRLHPVRQMMTNGLAVTISSDDPTFWDYQGLSLDFAYAFLGWQLDLKDLKQLAINAIKQSSVSEERKRKLLYKFKDDWSTFISSLTYSENTSS
jgi:adenosine deaminase